MHIYTHIYVYIYTYITIACNPLLHPMTVLDMMFSFLTKLDCKLVRAVCLTDSYNSIFDAVEHQSHTFRSDLVKLFKRETLDAAYSRYAKIEVKLCLVCGVRSMQREKEHIPY